MDGHNMFYSGMDGTGVAGCMWLYVWCVYMRSMRDLHQVKADLSLLRKPASNSSRFIVAATAFIKVEQYYRRK
jgi:hypothetical protein